MKNLNKLLIAILFALFFSNNVYSNQAEKTLLKINSKLFTSIDLNERINYLKYNQYKVNTEIKTKDFYLNDLISVIIFNEVFGENHNSKKQKIELKEIVDEYFENLNDIKIPDTLNEKKIKKHIRYDYQRKILIEKILNENRNKIFQENKEDLINIYEINLKYYSFNMKNYEILKNKIKIINFSSIQEVIKGFSDIKYLYIDKSIKFNDKINQKLKDVIQKNKKEFNIKLNDNNYIIGKVFKKIKINEKINFTLVQIKQNNDNKNKYQCDSIDNYRLDKGLVIKISKNVDYYKLNKVIKDNLFSLNDQVIINDNNNHTYIILCDIKYDETIVKNLNLNQRINELGKAIEKDFISTNSKKYKLLIYDK